MNKDLCGIFVCVSALPSGLFAFAIEWGGGVTPRIRMKNGQCSGLALSKACTDSINVIKSEVFSHAKGTPYISQRSDGKQIVKQASKNNDDIDLWYAFEQSSTSAEVHRVRELQLWCLLLHDCSCSLGCCNQMRTLLVLTSHTHLCQMARWSPQPWTSAKQTVPSCLQSHARSPSSCVAAWSQPTPSCAHLCLSFLELIPSDCLRCTCPIQCLITYYSATVSWGKE